MVIWLKSFDSSCGLFIFHSAVRYLEEMGVDGGISMVTVKYIHVHYFLRLALKFLRLAATESRITIQDLWGWEEGKRPQE